MSTYSLPSTSYTFDPLPWLIQTACGSAICQFDVAPPARCSRATRDQLGAARLAPQEDLLLVGDQLVDAS